MPSYKVKANGFFNGELYSPNGKRNVLVTDKALKPIPMWLEPMKGETGAQAQARRTAQNKSTKDAKKKAEDDRKAVEQVTFTGTPESITKTL